LAEIKGIQINQTIYVTNVESRDNWYIASVQDITDYELLISIPTKGTNPLVLKKMIILYRLLFQRVQGMSSAQKLSGGVMTTYLCTC
jgi:hypothetical protein